jgi:endonuclease YncB( thermonuclease family)
MKSPALFLVLAIGSTQAIAAPSDGYFQLETGVTLESGDSWSDGGQHFRLFGMQACLRGTVYTDRTGARRDCGEASLAVLAAYIADTKPLCAQVAQTPETAFASCYATIGSDRLDLAILLISSGFAFVVEQAAREKKIGLWLFDDAQHPAVLLGQAARDRGSQP